MKKRLGIFLAVALLVAAADLVTKHWAEGRLSSGEDPIVVTSWLNFVYSENPGAAFGLFKDRWWGRHFLTVISVLAGIFLFWFVVKTDDRPVLTAFTLGMILGGVIGNVWDRLFNEGQVRDFIDFHIDDWHWHTFNIADSGISVGVVLLLILGFFPRKKGGKKGADKK